MIHVKNLPKSEIEITGEISAEEFLKFWPRAIKELSQDINMPGFRRGNIPEKVLLKRIGEPAVLEKAAEMALRDIYPKILMDKKIKAIGMPRATITKMAKSNPLGFKFQTAVLPEIRLPGNYRETAAEIINPPAGGEEIKVEDKEIDDSMEYLRKTRARQNNKDKDTEDEFAKSVGAFKDAGELRDAIRKNLTMEKEFRGVEKRRLAALDSILKNAVIEIPDLLIEGEKNKMLLEMKGNIQDMGLKWEDYLKHLKKEEAEVLSGWTDDAVRRVKYGLLLSHLGVELQIEVTDEEVESELNKMPRQEEKFDRRRIKEYIYGVLRNEKIFTKLKIKN